MGLVLFTLFHINIVSAFITDYIDHVTKDQLLTVYNVLYQDK